MVAIAVVSGYKFNVIWRWWIAFWQEKLFGCHNKHFASLYFLGCASIFVLMEVLWESLFKLQSQALAHYADTIDCVNKGFSAFL
jgi:hypothetical protein